MTTSLMRYFLIATGIATSVFSGLMLFDTYSSNTLKTGCLEPKASPRPNSPTLFDGVHIPVHEQVPKLIIGGAQKAGTTSLLGILNHQENFMMNTWRNKKVPIELRFFTLALKPQTLPPPGIDHLEWRAFKRDVEGALTPNIISAIRQAYSNCWNFTAANKSPETTISLEKSPDYMVLHEVPKLIKKVAPWAKILFILREPVSRTYSAWRMFHTMDKKNKTVHASSFTDLVNLAVDILRRHGVSNAPTLQEFTSPDYVFNATAFDIPPDLTATLEAMRQDKTQNMKFMKTDVVRGMYSTHLAPWLEHYELGKDLMVVSHERLQEDHLGVIQEIQAFVGTNVSSYIPPEILEQNYHGGYTAPPIDDTTLQYLEHVFRPYNEQLATVMGQEWYDKNVGQRWDHGRLQESANTETTTTTTSTTQGRPVRPNRKSPALPDSYRR